MCSALGDGREVSRHNIRWLPVGVLEFDLPPFVLLRVEYPEIVQIVCYVRLERLEAVRLGENADVLFMPGS